MEQMLIHHSACPIIVKQVYLRPCRLLDLIAFRRAASRVEPGSLLRMGLSLIVLDWDLRMVAVGAFFSATATVSTLASDRVPAEAAMKLLLR